MRVSRPYSSLLFLLLTILVVSVTVRADEDDDPEVYDLKTRVVRISLISGEVTIKRRSSSDWERARLNYPVVEGDTIATDRESRVEIQIDARNFVRLSPNSMIRISTLRDEGVALTMFEGSAVLRLAKFDSKKEYFEIDAPKSTLAAEKKGLYRVDVGKDGRVRMTVHDGATARIYSENSGFALRDGRSAELVSEGPNAGDWEFTSASRDSLDDWVQDRERYLAQRLRYDVQYYDEYLWGAEDLDSYGNWAYSSDYGWVWRPHGHVLSAYSDWAPYRYGHWTWLDPYGWTWIGYEPWGWAPYHYGRWVYYNGSWAWCPRSFYYRNRSWWRPALVAFIHFGGGYNNNYCWYPLRYRQRDPHSSYYSNNPNRLTALRADELANVRRRNPVELRAVTSASARQIGSDNLRPQRADDALAARAMGTTPLRSLPARAPARGDTPSSGERGDVIVGRPARATPGVQPVERSTGAAARTPGVPLDDELRRTRVLNGREPRVSVPAETSGSGPVVTPETPPTGAVSRPARPRDTVERGDGSVNPGGDGEIRRRESRESTPTSVPSRSSGDVTPARPSVGTVEQPQRDAGEKPTRDRVRTEPARPETRNDSSSPPYEPPPQRSEPRNEAPRSAPPQRSEPPPQRSEPRGEPRQNSAPPQRSEPPPQRSEPPPQRSEPPPQRSEPPPQRSEPPPQRSEPPPQRSEPRSEPARPARPDRPDNSERSAPRSESRPEPSRSEPSRSEPSRSESPRSEPAPSRTDPEAGRPTAKPRDPRR